MTNTDTTLTAGVAWLRELAGTCKDEAQQWFDRSCEDEGQEWRVRGESYAFIADQIERGHSPFTALTKPAVKCGDGGAPLCSACSAPITELVQEPGCGGPLTALTQAPRSCWQPIETAPKTGKDLCAKPFLGWCLDDTAPGGGDIRVCWWEPHMDGGRWHGDRDLPEHPTHWQPLPAPPATDDVAAPRSCCADEREPRQENTIRALEEAAIDLWEQSPEIAKINPWVRCEWSEVSERSRIYWRGLALTTAIRSNSHD